MRDFLIELKEFSAEVRCGAVQCGVLSCIGQPVALGA